MQWPTEKLNEFYSILCYYHQKYYPEWRFGQFIGNFIAIKGDPYYMENEVFIEKMYEFVKELFPGRAKDIKDILKEEKEKA